MDDTPKNLLRDVILAAQAARLDSKDRAGKAAQAYPAGLAAYKQPVTRPATLPADHESAK